MPRVLLAVDAPRAARLSAELVREGVEVVGVVEAARPAAGWPEGSAADTLVLEVRRSTLTAGLAAECDARGIRVVPLCADEDARALAEAAGLVPHPRDVEGWVLAEALTAPLPLRRIAPQPATQGRTIVVWGPHGAPGRTSIAIELAAELSRGGRHVALVDADAHAPSVALALGLADEGPGFAAACRQSERGALDAAELTRISVEVPVAGASVDVLTGINRPGRWPELSEARVGAALSACRAWAEHVVVDVAASLERDEEIVSDLEGPRRNGATLAALRSADVVVAVCAADPVGVARFVRAFAELRSTIGATRVVVVVNRLRAGTMGVDARGQVRRTLERFADVERAWFLPLDPRAADAALLAGRPVADIAPRSPLAAAVRRLVGEALVPAPRAAAPRTRRRA
jgi:MinD-like ATPase involved in chromosome partitioning or flagellar assembly